MKQEKIIIHVDTIKMRNKMHFEVQRTTRANIFRDRTKYTRKRKHKSKVDQPIIKYSLD